MKFELQGNVFKNHNRFKVLTSNQEQTHTKIALVYQETESLPVKIQTCQNVNIVHIKNR